MTVTSIGKGRVMDLVKPNDLRYDEMRSVYNGMIDKRPAVIARCSSPTDVIEALELARTEHLEVAVRAGGHSVAGMCVNDDGLVIDVRPMKQIAVDLRSGHARVGAGVTWGEFDRATQQHGLATTGGRISTTGVAGFTLGGGSGWAERAFGLACDNLVSVDLVTAEGREVTASEDHNPDLFWALHGGGGNFGVATSFVFALHDLGPLVTAGLLMWSGDAGRQVAGAYRDYAYSAPDQFGSGLFFITAPPEEFVPGTLQGTTVAAIAALWVGDVDEGAEAMAPLRALDPDVDVVGPMPYAEFQCMIDDPPGRHNYWSAEYLDTLPDAALDVFVTHGFERPSPFTQPVLMPWGGAVARVGEDATPMTKRNASWVVHPFAMWEDPADSAKNIAWTKAVRRDMEPYANGGIYLNYIGHEGPDRVRAAYGEEKYRRLATIKAEWDPTNRFKGNQNIQPA
jgi:FAD/FMN-containing dehydrogenase